MEKTRFEVRVRARQSRGRPRRHVARWTERGLETAEFLLSPEPGRGAAAAGAHRLRRRAVAHPARPEVRGQRSTRRGKTLVFDEVDAGIGGRVAEVVGRKLRAIAERHQVLCVTHLPQIASLADRHYVGAQARRARAAR